MLTSLDVELSLKELRTIPGPYQRALFVALALEPNSQISRDWLADLLWPDVSQSQARQRLRMTLFNLRNSLGGSDCISIEANNETISLRIDFDRIDVALFERFAENPADWLSALEIYRGNLLSQFPSISNAFDQHLAARRERLKERFLSIALQLLRGSKRDRDMARFETTYQAVTQADPGNEAAAILAMEFWAAEGAADKVEAAFRLHEAHVRELNGEPLEPHFLQSYEKLIQHARSASISGKPSLAFPNAEVAAGQTNGKKRNWIAAALVTATVAATAGFLVLQDRIRNAGGPIFLVLRPATSLERCTLEAPLEKSSVAILEVLRSIEHSVVVVGNLRRYFVLPNDGAFLVRQHIECSGNRFRATFTFIDRKTRDVVVSVRSTSLPVDRKELLGQIINAVKATPNS